MRAEDYELPEEMLIEDGYVFVYPSIVTYGALVDIHKEVDAELHLFDQDLYEGMKGLTYALYWDMRDHAGIRRSVQRFLDFAEQHTELTFYVQYLPVMPLGWNGDLDDERIFPAKEIALLFRDVVARELTNVLMTRKMVTTIFDDIDPLWRGR